MIREYLKNNVLLFDGAMGTYFSSIHDDPLYKCEYANITSPNTIKEIHKRYLKAGAKAIKTNTFSLFDENAQFTSKEIITSAYKLATECAKEFDAFVFCDIGTVNQDYIGVVDTFIELGGENFIFETFFDVDTINKVSKYIKSKVPNAYIIGLFSVSSDGFTKTGNFGEKLLKDACEHVDSVGFNCNCGPFHMASLAKNIEFKEKPLAFMPNASYPTVVGQRVVYDCNPSYFAKQMLEIVKSGAKIIGGCCGTTPEFIKFINEENINLKEVSKVSTKSIKVECEIVKSAFYEKLMSNKKPIAVELDPPMNTSIDDFMQGAKILKEMGTDLITIADCPVARVRMDSSLLACKLKREVLIDVMPHMTCRDRNINASKALLLGLNMEKVSDVLIVTGDPLPSESRNEIKTVYEFNSRMLVKHISGLNDVLFDSPFYLYSALNINAKNFAIQLKIAKQKVEHGTIGFFTQPALTDEAVENLKIAKSELNVPIAGGILPIVSYRNACFINNEIPGINVCEKIVEKYKDKDKDECRKLAIDISVEMAKKIAPYIDGYYIITPFKRVDIVSEIIKEIKQI